MHALLFDGQLRLADDYPEPAAQPGAVGIDPEFGMNEGGRHESVFVLFGKERQECLGFVAGIVGGEHRRNQGDAGALLMRLPTWTR